MQDLAEFFKLKTPSRLFAELALSAPGAPIKAAVETVRMQHTLIARAQHSAVCPCPLQLLPTNSPQTPHDPNEQALKFAVVPGIILGETLPLGESTLTSLEGSTIKVGPAKGAATVP